MRGPSSNPPSTASRTVTSVNHLPPGTAMLVTPARRTRPIACAAQRVQNSAVEVYFMPGSALVKRDVAMRVDEAGQDELARGINDRCARGLRPHRAVSFADKSDPVSLDDEEPVRDRIAA